MKYATEATKSRYNSAQSAMVEHDDMTSGSKTPMAPKDNTARDDATDVDYAPDGTAIYSPLLPPRTADKDLILSSAREVRRSHHEKERQAS